MTGKKKKKKRTPTWDDLIDWDRETKIRILIELRTARSCLSFLLAKNSSENKTLLRLQDILKDIDPITTQTRIMKTKTLDPKADEFELTKHDISCEAYREYDFAGRVYRIKNPKILFYRKDGGTTHRVIDGKGVAHCLPAPGVQGCVLRWKSLDADKPVNF